MAKCTIEFGVSIGDQVMIHRAGLRGKVVGLYCDVDGIRSYYTEYVNRSGSVLSHYFRDDDLRPADPMETDAGAETPGVNN